MWRLTVCLVGLLLGQDPQAGMSDRGAMVMGFDQDKTAHHFYLYEDGGAIQIAVKDLSDTKDRDAIRSHLPHIAMMFGAGDFEAPMLVHDTKGVPGIKVLAERKDKVAYRYADTATGGRVEIITTDAPALSALHDFLKYQIAEHDTGDTGAVTRRGK
jgi:hypothetical protein